MPTKIITVREFRENQARYFNLAETQRIVIKRGKKLITLSVATDLIENNEDWLSGFFAIPEQYRCNPYDISPSGDLFFADKRNVENFKTNTAIAYQQIDEGKLTKVKTKEELTQLLESL